MGSEPWIMIGDIECAKEAFLDKKNEIAGRPEFRLCKYSVFYIFNY